MAPNQKRGRYLWPLTKYEFCEGNWIIQFHIFPRLVSNKSQPECTEVILLVTFECARRLLFMCYFEWQQEQNLCQREADFTSLPHIQEWEKNTTALSRVWPNTVSPHGTRNNIDNLGCLWLTIGGQKLPHWEVFLLHLKRLLTRVKPIPDFMENDDKYWILRIISFTMSYPVCGVSSNSN